VIIDGILTVVSTLQNCVGRAYNSHITQLLRKQITEICYHVVAAHTDLSHFHLQKIEHLHTSYENGRYQNSALVQFAATTSTSLIKMKVGNSKRRTTTLPIAIMEGPAYLDTDFFFQ